MKRSFVSFLVFATVLGFTCLANATLFDRGGGLIYDDVLGVTWLQNAQLADTETFGVSLGTYDPRMVWDTAIDWIDAMNAANYLSYNDWRLPTATDGTAAGWTYDGSSPMGWNVTNSELGYMFYENLGNIGGYFDGSSYYATDGTEFASLPELNTYIDANFTDSFTDGNGNPVSLENLQRSVYWSGTVLSNPPSTDDAAWAFGFGNGQQFFGYIENVNPAYNSFNAWAVRPGDSGSITPPGPDPVPEPATILLLGAGLIGLAGGFRRKMKK